jgi:hypothetical protein
MLPGCPPFCSAQPDGENEEAVSVSSTIFRTAAESCWTVSDHHGFNFSHLCSVIRNAVIIAVNGLLLFPGPDASAQQIPYRALRISENLALNGKMDAPVWLQAEPVTDFMQTDPVPGADATEKTEARIVYNNDYLYVGIRCYDREPQKIIQVSLNRDFAIGNEDGTAFIIDTYNDKTNGYNFISNASGARWDAQVSSDGGSLNDAFNTFWDVASNTDSLGYTTVYRIPWSSLRFETRAVVTMGFRVTRLIKRKNELSTYPRCDPATEEAWTNISFMRPIEFHDLKSRKPLLISPYAIANYVLEQQLNAEGTGYEAEVEIMARKYYAENEVVDKIISNLGVDAKYGISKNLTLDLTLNTDFAQAEVDDRIINLTKFDVNLPEKRSFFLESSSFLTFTFPSGNELFISRSIGNENGVIVPIIGGARLTGKTNGWQIGALNMQTKGIEESAIAPHNFSVFRIRKDVDTLGSFVGGIVTNRLNTDSGHLSNQSIGLSFVKRFTQQFSIEAAVASTLTNLSFDSIANSSYYQAAVFRSATVGLIYSASLDFVGKNFFPVMGYLDESDYGQIGGHFKYQWRGKKSGPVQYYYVSSGDIYRWKLSSGVRETFETDIWTGAIFRNGANVEFSVWDYKIDSLFYDWHLDEENAISAGTYSMFNANVYLSAPSRSKYFLDLFSSYGGFYGGMRLAINPELTYFFNRHLSTEVVYEFNHISFDKYLDLNTPTTYVSHLLRLGLAYTFSTKTSLKLYTQYDNISHTFGSNLRFRYNPREGTDLYIVLNQGSNTNRDRLDPRLPLINNQAVTVKFVKTFGQ